MNKLEQWRSVETQDKILAKDLSNKDEVLQDAFKESMEFGTAGIRGVMGAGTNKMNEFTVAAAAEAYAKYLIKNVKDAKKNGVVIGHDNRHNSAFFSEVTARVLMANGIKAYLYEGNELQPTPLVSYTIRKLKLAGAAIITASHNPKEYNGFKVYNSLGGQVLPHNTETIQKYMKTIDPLTVKRSNDELVYLGKDIVDSYMADTLDKVWMSKGYEQNISVAFSPLHGTSAKIIPEVLTKMGIENFIVKSQATPDGDFSKTKSQNPEEQKAFAKVLSLAKRKKADVFIATDPDADRFGAVVRTGNKYKFLNGNQTAAVYLSYKLTKLKREGKLPKNGYIVKSIVSGELPVKIAEQFGIKVYETHVGFKNIADVIEKTKGTFIMGYEESYGFLLNKELARDKDSVQATIGVVEMINYLKSQASDTYKLLLDLYDTKGIHKSTQVAYKIDAKVTTKVINFISKKKSIGDHKVKEVLDFRTGVKGFDKANVVKVIFEDGSWIAIRPSGTEPKVKFYVQTIGQPHQGDGPVNGYEQELKDFLDEVVNKYTK